jgi:large subunit ribosomal protein L9
MEVILSQDVKNLGKTGDVVKVKDGYARNFLFPNNFAYVASPSNLKRIERLAQKKQEEYKKEKQVALDLADKLGKISCTVSAEVNDLEKLYGAITEAEIIKAIEVEGFTIDKKQLEIEKPVDELGIFEIGVRLHPEVSVKIRLWVTKK